MTHAHVIALYQYERPIPIITRDIPLLVAKTGEMTQDLIIKPILSYFHLNVLYLWSILHQIGVGPLICRRRQHQHCILKLWLPSKPLRVCCMYQVLIASPIFKVFSSSILSPSSTNVSSSTCKTSSWGLPSSSSSRLSLFLQFTWNITLILYYLVLTARGR